MSVTCCKIAVASECNGVDGICCGKGKGYSASLLGAAAESSKSACKGNVTDHLLDMKDAVLLGIRSSSSGFFPQAIIFFLGGFVAVLVMGMLVVFKKKLRMQLAQIKTMMMMTCKVC